MLGDDELLAIAESVFPIHAGYVSIELERSSLIDAAGNLAPAIRMSAHGREIATQTLILVPAADRLGERVVPYFAAVRADISRRSPEDLEQCMPSDLFVGELLGEREILPDAFPRILGDPRARLLITVPPARREGVVIDPLLRIAPPVLANPELEARMTEDDVELYGVYADWLADRGDPRSELVAVQLARELEPGDAGLAAREKWLLAEYAYEWLGGFAWIPEGDFSVRWHYGFIHAITLGSEDEAPDESIGDLTFDGLVELPSANLMRELIVRPHGFWDDQAFAILGTPGFPNGWRLLDIKTPEFTELGTMEPGYPNLAKLETLRLESNVITLGKVVLPSLVSCELVTPGLTVVNLGEMRTAVWPKLERLVLWLGDAGIADCDVELEDLGWIFAGENLANLRELGLCGRDAGELLWRLAEAPILTQLVILDLSGCYFDDAARQFLADRAEDFAHLRVIHVHESGDGIAANAVVNERWSD